MFLIVPFSICQKVLVFFIYFLLLVLDKLHARMDCDIPICLCNINVVIDVVLDYFPLLIISIWNFDF